MSDLLSVQVINLRFICNHVSSDKMAETACNVVNLIKL